MKIRGLSGPFLAALLVHAGILSLGVLFLRSARINLRTARKSGAPIDIEMQQGIAKQTRNLAPSQRISQATGQEVSLDPHTPATSVNIAPAGNHIPSPSGLNPTPTEGPSGASLAQYENDLRNRIEGSLKYPTSLRRRGIQGISLLKIQIPAHGGPGTVEIIQSSGSLELDELALHAANAATPFPSPPSELLDSRNTLTVQLPIKFKLSP